MGLVAKQSLPFLNKNKYLCRSNMKTITPVIEPYVTYAYLEQSAGKSSVRTGKLCVYREKKEAMRWTRLGLRRR